VDGTVTANIDNDRLRSRQAASQRGFYRALGGGSPGARLAEPSAEVQATIVPIRPWFSIFNSVLYRDPGALLEALPGLAEAYDAEGVNSWTVWVPPGDDHTAEELQAAGHVRDSTPLLMAAPISEIDLAPRVELELAAEPSWETIARCNDRAHGVLSDWTMAAVFADMNDPATARYAACRGSEVVSCLLARERDGDCYFWFVATVPEAQGHGLASELMRHALSSARERGCDTTSLESTRAGESVYARLGYRSLGRYTMWERNK
jgi:ribosomal protein S18 acetylase RimI-like enzyme